MYSTGLREFEKNVCTGKKGLTAKQKRVKKIIPI